ncbi:hypothetical protein EON66_04515 [archaeon]|nr:MAG: hypothetical protein EON66_04515 [archaeon]
MAWSADPSHSPLHISTHGHDPAASPLLYTERSAHVGTGVEFFGDVGGWDTHDTLHSGASPLLPPPAAPPARARPQSAAPVFTTQQQPLPQQVHGHGQSAMPSSGAAARRPQSALPVARSRQLIVPADAVAAA